ncbi:2,3-bisphosphoglycerate-independent phosphoglycerate mutase [Halobacteriales archaeon SW_7_68_16]|nr:MAG: 2,3-bisphosphoglycerate-independent phosphoglycerate mutase [Halobacteriales archaeon SW_7_68_16]
MQAALVILDGWGLADHDRRNAVTAAGTPTVDDLCERGADTTLRAAGRDVGLPPGSIGNSEVGHENLGAGRVVEQDATRIDEAIETGRFGRGDALGAACEGVAPGGRLHLIGLVSDGGVHALQRHLHAAIEVAADAGVEAVTHAITDGRDTPPTSAPRYLTKLERAVERAGTGDVATVVGRYYAMDRDGNWDRTRRAYRAIVAAEGDHDAPTTAAAIDRAHDRGETDEFVAPTTLDGGVPMSDGDAVVTLNFRADRMRQLGRALGGLDPGFGADPPDLRVTTATRYGESFPFPVVVPPADPTDTLGEIVADAGLTQLRVAESEKAAHVTYFFGGGRESPFPGERREIVPSPDVATYDETPAMNAATVTDRALAAIETDDPDLLVLNYANPDMVGHTGDCGATIAAVETVDNEVARLVPALFDAGATVLVTADHGNAEDVGTADDPHTAHTTNPVPATLLAPDGTDGGRRLGGGGRLANVAPTLSSPPAVSRSARDRRGRRRRPRPNSSGSRGDR